MGNALVVSPLQRRGRVGDLKLKNKIIMAPMTRGCCPENRVPGEKVATYYVQRAGAGLIISEGTHPMETGIGWVGAPCIYNDEHVEGWKNVTAKVHEAGGLIFCQLWHTGRASHSEFIGRPPLGPSAIGIQGTEAHTPSGKKPMETPQPMSIEEIKETVANFKSAAQRAKDAGFDGVEIHGANGYLLDTFCQSRTNQRDDDYGGTIEKRFQFSREVIEAVLEVWPASRVGYRISPNGVFNDMGSDDFREQFLYIAKEIAQYKLGYLHVMDGLAFGFHEKGEAMKLSEIRAAYGRRGTIMANCGYTKEMGEEALKNGWADLICYGRPFINNPDLPVRFAKGYPLEEPVGPDKWYGGISTEDLIGYTPYDESKKVEEKSS